MLSSFRKGKNLARISIGSKRRYAIHMLADTLDGIPSISGPTGPVGPTPHIDGGLSPPDPAPRSEHTENQREKPGAESSAARESVPIAPTAPETEHKTQERHLTPDPPVKQDAQESADDGGFFV